MVPFNEFKPSEILKNYISFLKDGFLDNFVYTNIKLSYEYKLPLMNQIEGLSEARKCNIFEIGIKAFYEDVLKDRVLQGVIDILDDWKNKSIVTEISNISYNDIILSYMIRKQALVQYIDYYSSEPEEFISLVQELNKLISEIEDLTIKFFQSDDQLKNMIAKK